MNSWFASMFAHPEFMIPGTALVALPVLIHLINRLRYTRVRWAAMEFLLASQQRNRRRLFLEQLLLLAMRMAAVVALAALVARPFIYPEQFSLFQGEKTHHAIVLDDTGSMRDRWGETTAFDAAKEVIRKIAAEGERRPDSQTLSLFLVSKPDQPVYTVQNLNADLLGRLDAGLKGLAATHRAAVLAPAVQSARNLLIEQRTGVRHLHLISDYRLHDWQEEAELPRLLAGMQSEKIAVNLIKTVPESHANLGITELTGAVDVAAANVPMRLAVTVKNYGEQSVRDTRLTILIDGKKLPAVETIESLEPLQETTREFDVLFPTVGPHEVQVSLPADAIEQDNHRHLALALPDSNPVLIIDGSPGAGEAFYLADALAPAPGITGFAPSIETLEFLRRRPIDRYQSVFLLNVAELPPDAAEALEKHVAAGAGLAWYLGDQVRALHYNDKLYREGAGLFPLALGAAADLPVDEIYEAPDMEFNPHPVFRLFEGDDNPFVDLVKVGRYFGAAKDWAAPDGVQVIARLRNRAPLMLEHRFGKGTVLTCLTSLGAKWNNWPRIPPAFVSLQLEIARHIARKSAGQERKQAGEPVRITLEAAAYLPEAVILSPGGARTPLTLGVRSTGAKAGELPIYEETFRDTDTPGIYQVALKRQDGTEEQRRIAVNVPETESRLALVTSEALRRRLGPESRAQIQEPGDFNWVHGEETTRDIHDLVLAGLLILLLAEQALALRLSHHPHPAGAHA
jgi:Aerotolerance regulator N-terminal/CARDB